MLIKTRGIVFRSIKYGETSLIVDIFTEERGLRSYLINGVRSKRGKVRASLLQLMSLVDMVAYDKHERGLNRVKEIRPAEVYRSLPFDVRKSAVGLFMVEMARKSIREPEHNPRLFEFLYRSFHFLDDTTGPIGNLHLHFLLELSFHLGFVPNGNWAAATPFFDLQEGVFVAEAPTHGNHVGSDESRMVDRLLNSTYANCSQVEMTSAQRRLLLRKLIDFFRFHVENLSEIHAHEVLQEVLE